MKYYLAVLVVVAGLLGCEDKPTVEEVRERAEVKSEESRIIEQPDSKDSVAGIKPGSAVSPVDSAEQKTAVEDLRELNPYIEIYGEIAEKVVSGPLVFGVKAADVPATDCETEGVESLNLQEYAAWEPKPNVKLAVVVCHASSGQVLTVMPAASFVQDVELLFAAIDEDSVLTLSLDKGENPWNTEVEIEFLSADTKNRSLQVTAEGVGIASSDTQWVSLAKLRPKKTQEGESATLVQMPAGFATEFVRVRTRNLRQTATEWGEKVKAFLATDGVTDIADLQEAHSNDESDAVVSAEEEAPNEEVTEVVEEVVEEQPPVETPPKEMTELEKQVAAVEDAFVTFENLKLGRDELRAKLKDARKSVKAFSAELRAAKKSNRTQQKEAKKVAKEKKVKYDASALKQIDTKPYEEALALAKTERAELVEKLSQVQKETKSAKLAWKKEKKALNMLKKKLKKEQKA